MDKKICRKCSIEKSFSEFYKNKRMYDGFNSYCKNCIKKVTADYMKKYSKTDKGKAALKKGREKLIEAGYFRYGYGAISHIRQAALRRGSSFNLTSWPVPQISYTNLV